MNTRLVATLLALTSLGGFASPAMANQDVGVAAAVNKQALGTPPGLPTRTIILGNNIIYKERIETGGSGLVQVLLVDGSTFTVGANSNLVIDEFVYDPAAGTGKLVASFGKGVARFVGGKLSKNQDGVNVKTPVGTIGIRGGIANIDVKGNSAAFSLIYGKELTFTGRGGARQRVYEAGYTIAVGEGGSGGEVRRTTRNDLGGIQNALGGRPGQNGGISRPPTDNQVANSGIQRVNSGLGIIRTVPVPKPQVVRATELEQVDSNLIQVAQLDKVPDVKKPDPKPDPTPTPTPTPDPTPSPNPTPSPDPTPDPTPDPNEPTKPEPTPTPTPTPTPDPTPTPNPNPNPTPTPTTEEVQARALFGGSGYEVPGGSAIVSNPGAQGIIGNNGSTTADVTLTLQSNANAAMSSAATTAGAILRGTANGGQVSVPVPTSSGMHYFLSAITSTGKHFGALAIDSVPVLPTINASTQGTITHIGRGAYYRGAHNFFALAYQAADTPETTPTFDGDLGDITYLFGGTPTSFSSMVVTSGTPKLRTYTLEGDMQQAIRFGEESGGTLRILSSKALFMNPVATEALGMDFMADVQSSGLSVLEGTGSAVSTKPLALASSFLIEGKGSQQKSLVSLFAGEVFDDTVSLKMQGNRRGGYRSSSVESSANFMGRIKSVAGTDGAHAFGNNAQNFILSADLGNQPYHDSFAVVPSGMPLSKQFASSMHIANLQSYTDSTTLTRSDRGIAGYGAGVLQQPDGSGGLSKTVLTTVHPLDMSLDFDATRKSVSASMRLTETGYQDDPVSSTDQGKTLDISFGDESTAIEDPRRSVFIDDDRYAALESNSSSSSPTLTDNAGNSSLDAKATSYFLPSTMVANGDAGLFAPGQKCTCSFLEWGYWGTSIATDNPAPSAPDTLNQVHLGTWAAGRILGPGDMPTTGTATYTGHAVGSVVNGGAQYLAAGDFSMSVDFAARNGTAAISDFDGRNFTSALTAGSLLDDKNRLSGSITDGATMTGSFNASLVEGPNSPIDGVVGGFSAFDGAWSATGIVVGEKP